MLTRIIQPQNPLHSLETGRSRLPVMICMTSTGCCCRCGGPHQADIADMARMSASPSTMCFTTIRRSIHDHEGCRLCREQRFRRCYTAADAACLCSSLRLQASIFRDATAADHTSQYTRARRTPPLWRTVSIRCYAAAHITYLSAQPSARTRLPLGLLTVRRGVHEVG